MDAKIVEAEKQIELINRSVKSAADAIKGISFHLNAIQDQVDQSVRDILAESILLGNDGKYDYSNILAKPEYLNKFFNYKVYIKTEIILEVPEELRRLIPSFSEKTERSVEAPGIVIGQYVLMASHVSDADMISQHTVRFPFGEKTYKFKILKYNIKLLTADGSNPSLKELYRNKEHDFGLFLAPSSKTQNFPFKIGKSDELMIGNYIYMNGRPNIRLEIARPGFVSALETAFLDGAQAKKFHNQFSITQSTDHGDSSSPVIAFRDGKPELVGIYLGWVQDDNDNGRNTKSRVLKINTVVDEIREKTGVDLRELQRKILYK